MITIRNSIFIIFGLVVFLLSACSSTSSTIEANDNLDKVIDDDGDEEFENGLGSITISNVPESRPPIQRKNGYFSDEDPPAEEADEFSEEIINEASKVKKKINGSVIEKDLEGHTFELYNMVKLDAFPDSEGLKRYTFVASLEFFTGNKVELYDDFVSSGRAIGSYELKDDKLELHFEYIDSSLWMTISDLKKSDRDVSILSGNVEEILPTRFTYPYPAKLSSFAENTYSDFLESSFEKEDTNLEFLPKDAFFYAPTD